MRRRQRVTSGPVNSVRCLLLIVLRVLCLWMRLMRYVLQCRQSVLVLCTLCSTLGTVRCPRMLLLSVQCPHMSNGLLVRNNVMVTNLVCRNVVVTELVRNNVLAMHLLVVCMCNVLVFVCYMLVCMCYMLVSVCYKKVLLFVGGSGVMKCYVNKCQNTLRKLRMNSVVIVVFMKGVTLGMSRLHP